MYFTYSNLLLTNGTAHILQEATIAGLVSSGTSMHCTKYGINVSTCNLVIHRNSTSVSLLWFSNCHENHTSMLLCWRADQWPSHIHVSMDQSFGCASSFWVSMLIWSSFSCCVARLGMRSANFRYQSPEWTILSHVDCFIQWEVIGFQVLLDSLHPRSTRASWWSHPVL